MHPAGAILDPVVGDFTAVHRERAARPHSHPAAVVHGPKLGQYAVCQVDTALHREIAAGRNDDGSLLSREGGALTVYRQLRGLITAEREITVAAGYVDEMEVLAAAPDGVISSEDGHLAGDVDGTGEVEVC